MEDKEKTDNAPVTEVPVVETPKPVPAPKPTPDAPPKTEPKPAPRQFTPDEIREAEKVVTQPYYKLRFRTASGAIRGDISKEVVRQISIDWSDLLRVIPQHRWVTFDEILNLAWDLENRSLRKLYTRTRKQIEDGVRVLLECGVLDKKN